MYPFISLCANLFWCWLVLQYTDSIYVVVYEFILQSNDSYQPILIHIIGHRHLLLFINSFDCVPIHIVVSTESDVYVLIYVCILNLFYWFIIYRFTASCTESYFCAVAHIHNFDLMAQSLVILVPVE